MTQSTSSQNSPQATSDSPTVTHSRGAREPGRGGELVTAKGRTTIADGVVSKIAGIATREVSGVHAVGGGTARAVGAVRERMGGKSHSQGVAVEVGERQAAVDVDVVVDYGVSIADLAEGIRSNVIRSIERMTGLEVTEVNVSVDDIFIPSEDEGQDSEESAPPRVQ